MGRGLRPQPPPLADVVPEWSTAELFWIAKHGIRMTGMPAWGPTHGDDELWAMVAFVKTLPTMSAEDYRRMEMEAANGRPERAQPERGQGH
jgi:mono/diheme cytochrome c family protein